MTMILGLVLGAALAVAVWRWAVHGADDAWRLAVIASLAALASVFNFVVPLPSVEATTLVVLCCVLAVDLRAAVAVGILCSLATGAVGGLGIWSLWQMLGIVAAAVVILVSAGAWRARPRIPVEVLVVTTVLATLAYDAVVTVGTLVAFGGGSSEDALDMTFTGALLGGAPFTLVHVVTNALLVIVAAPLLLQSLERAATRMGTATAR